MALPNALLINLDRSPERLTFATEVLSQSGISFKRVSAVDGSQMSDEEYQTLIEQARSSKKWFRHLTKNEICCLKSHRLCWQTIVDENLPYALVFEDDLALEATPDIVIPAIETVIQSDVEWDVIKLSRCHQKRIYSISLDQGYSLHHCVPQPIDATASLISLSGAKKLLAMSEQLDTPTDFIMKRIWENDLKIYSLHPNLFRQRTHEEVPSIIGDRDNYKRLPRKDKIKVYAAKYRYHIWFSFNQTMELCLRYGISNYLKSMRKSR